MSRIEEGERMPSYINVQNNLSTGLDLSTSVAPGLDSEYWGVDSKVAVAGQLTRILWVDRNVGIKDGKTWVFTTSVGVAGIPVQLQVSLTGTFAGSDITIQIVASGKATGWASNDTSLLFPGGDGTTYEINGTFFLNGLYDDVTFSLIHVG